MKDADEPVTVPVETLARLFDVTARRVQILAKDGVIPKAARGRYLLHDCVRGYIGFLQERVSRQDVGQMSREIRTEQLRRVRLENDAREGMTLPVEDVREMLLNLGLVFTAALDAAPGRMAPLVIGKDQAKCLEILTTEHRRIRDETAAKLERLSTTGEPRGPDKGAGQRPASPLGGKE